MIFERAASELQWSAMGRHYGYPSCCIKEFNATHCQATKDQYPDGPWRGTGYLPCQDCAPAAYRDFSGFVATHIRPKRREAQRFPHDVLDDEDFDAILERAVAEASWLLRTKIGIYRLGCDVQDWLDYALHPRRP